MSTMFVHQYCCPIVTSFDGSFSQESRMRWNKIPIRGDNCIFSLVDGPHQISNANPPRHDDSMYTLFNTSSIANVKLADEKLSPLEPPSNTWRKEKLLRANHQWLHHLINKEQGVKTGDRYQGRKQQRKKTLLVTAANQLVHLLAHVVL